MAITQQQLIAIIKRKQADDSLRTFATKLEVSAAYLSDVYLNKRGVGPAILKHFGYAKVRTAPTVLYYKMTK
jgi:hypothetical protein